MASEMAVPGPRRDSDESRGMMGEVDFGLFAMAKKE